MAEETPSATHEATLAVMRALIDEIHTAAHDPQIVHLVAEKLKDGIDALERALTGGQPTKDGPPKASKS